MLRTDLTKNWERHRIKSPTQFKAGSFKTIVHNKYREDVIGRLKGKKTTSIQSVRVRRNAPPSVKKVARREAKELLGR